MLDGIVGKRILEWKREQPVCAGLSDGRRKVRSKICPVRIQHPVDLAITCIWSDRRGSKGDIAGSDERFESAAQSERTSIRLADGIGAADPAKEPVRSRRGDKNQSIIRYIYKPERADRITDAIITVAVFVSHNRAT